MAAAAYDVAAVALKGTEATLNFPAFAGRYPVPASNSPADIRSAATAAGQLMMAEFASSTDNAVQPRNNSDNTNDAAAAATEFLDEEAIFSMPSLLVDMAEGMLLSPPRMSPPSHDSPEDYSGGESLWNY